MCLLWCRNLVWITTGNNYVVPQSYSDCVSRSTSAAAKQRCNDPANYVDSVLALRMTTGSIVWSALCVDVNVWTIFNKQGGDYDFAQVQSLLAVTAAPIA